MTTSLQIRGKTIKENDVYIIGEMACAHNGDFNRAKQLIDIAAQARVNAVQFQIFDTEHNVVSNHRLHNALKEIQFSRDQWKELYDYARTKEIDVFACAYDDPSLIFTLELGFDGVKFNSSDLSYTDMLVRIAKSGVPFTLGVGASTQNEIQAALDCVRNAGGRDYVLMYGVQSFPTAINEAHIKRIQWLRDTFGCCVGYADHTSGDDFLAQKIDLVALGYGARVLEKHYTVSRAEKGFDYQAALEPAELQEYVRTVRSAQSALGEAALADFTEKEITYRRFQKKQIVAAVDLAKGTTLTRERCSFLRTEEGEGYAPNQIAALIGRQIVRDISRHALIYPKDVGLSS